MWIILVVVGGLAGGCNVLEGSGAAPESVDALLADARIALATGKASRAVRLLERAFQKDSTDVRVRVELGSALFAEQEIDVFTLRRVADHLVGPVDSTNAGRGTATRPLRFGKVCTDESRPDASSDRYRAISIDAEPLRRLAEHQSVVERVRRLVGRGVLERRSSALSEADLRIRRKGLLVGAVAAAGKAIIDVHSVVVVTESTLFLDRGARPAQALLACAEGEERLRRTHGTLCGLTTAIRRAVEWLRDRNRLSGGDQQHLLIGRLQTLAAAASAQVECS